MLRWVLLVVMLATAAVLAQPPDDVVTLAVMVTYEDGTPYTRRATVCVTRPGEGLERGFERPTRADGAYVFLGLGPGEYEVSAYVLEYLLWVPTQKVTVQPGANTCRLAMPRFPLLTGELSPAAKGDPAPTVALGYTGNGVRFASAPVVVKDGAYTVLRRPADARRLLLATDVGYALLDFAPPAKTTDDLRLPLALVRGGTGIFRVTDTDGAPVAGAIIRLARALSATNVTVELTTNADGEATSPHLPPGDWGYGIRATGLRPAYGLLALETAKPTPLVVALAP